MVGEGLFSGYGISAVDDSGCTRLPPFILQVLGQRAESQVLFGVHEVDACISGFDETYLAILHSEVERRRIRDELLDRSPNAHLARVRQSFGTVQEAGFDHDGKVTLPPMLRRRSGIGRSALFVGTGGTFEIWEPGHAREADPLLGEMADFASARSTEGEERE